MNLYIHFLIKSASCLLAATTLIMASSCTWLEGDLLDLSGGEPADITIDQLYKRMSAATDPKGVYAKAKSYRLIQEVPKNKWAEKFEQERISDAVEALTGAPLPMRYRSMFGSQISQLRFNEREYESFEDFCVSFEDFLSVKDAANEKVMEAEIRRQSFFNWEREEIYVVDSDSYMPLWMNEV